MHSTARIVVAALTLASVMAFGQTEPDVDVRIDDPRNVNVTVDDPNDIDDDPVDNRPNLMSRIGIGADVGGGLHNFVDRGLRDITETGGAWEVRATIGTRSHIAGELAYVGTANALNAIGVDDRAVLVSNGVEVLARANLLTGDWQPYAVAGYTYRRFNISNTSTNTSALVDGDNASEIPVGLGMAFRYRGLITDARFMVHPAVESDLQPGADTLPTALSLGLKLGFEF